MISFRPLLVAAPVLILQACADAPTAPPKIERISAEQLEASLPQPVAALPLDQVVALARQGVAAEDIIARITASASRYRLSAGQIVELAQQGVPLAVLDHVVAAERWHVLDDMAADANNRDQACRDRIDHEARLCQLQLMGPVLKPPPYPMINCIPSPPGSSVWRCF